MHRVGSLEPRKVDVQVIAATNRDLEIECDEGRFRRDLFYRLNVVEMHVPPLRDRREDIVYLANAFMRATADASREATERAHVGRRTPVARSRLAGQCPRVAQRDRARLPHGRGEAGRRTRREGEPAGATSVPCTSARRARSPAPPLAAALDGREDDLEPLSDVEREHIMRALQHANGNKKKAASLLGVSRRALYRKLERLDLGVTIARRGQGAA